MNTTVLSIIVVLLIVGLTLLPVSVVLVNAIDLNAKVDSSNLNGLITACGIFVAFISASVISKAEYFSNYDFWLMRSTLFLFVGSVSSLSFTLITDGFPKIYNLVLFSMTLILASTTMWVLINTMFTKSRSMIRT